MSWFNRAPRPKNPPSFPPPKHFSPLAEKALEEQKELVRGTTKKKKLKNIPST